MNTNEKKAPKARNGFPVGIAVGLGTGLAAGGIGGYFIARKKMLKKCKEDVKKAYERGYSKGEDDAVEESKEAIAEIMEGVIVAESDSVEDVQKAIEEHKKKQAEEESEKSGRYPFGSECHHELVEKIRELYDMNKNPEEIAQRLNLPEDFVKAVIANVIMTESGEKSVQVVENKAIAGDILNKAYEDALKASGMADDDTDAWDEDLTIDDEEAMRRSEERSKYLDEMERYAEHPEMAPSYISRKTFEEECHLTKDWVTYYAGDNVFASDIDADQKMDAFNNFGVVDGNSLFNTRVIDDDDNDDPNIVYIRNFKENSVYEVTRVPGSYAELKSGEVYFKNGTANTTSGNGGS